MRTKMNLGNIINIPIIEKQKIINIFLFSSLFFTRFYMLGRDIVNRDAFHFKDWSYVFMKELEAGNWNKLFVTIQPGILTIYSNIIGFKFLYFFRDKLAWVTSEEKQFELLMHTYQKIPQALLVVFLSALIFYLIYKLFDYWMAVFFMVVYIFEPFLVIYSRFIQTDALQSILILTSILMLLYWRKTEENRYLLLSGLLGGLGFIEKSSTVALLPYMIFLLGILHFDGLCSLRSIEYYVSWIKHSFIFVFVFFSTAFILFPAYWVQPVETFLRMTLDAYIHGVGGVNLDSYDFVRPDGLGNPIKFHSQLSLLDLLKYNHTLVYLLGLLFGVLGLVVGFYRKDEREKITQILFIVGFSVYFFFILQLSNFVMPRYFIVSTLPLLILSSYGYSFLVDILKFRVKVSAISLFLTFSIIGLVNYFYYAPDWGVYHNIFGTITGNRNPFARGSGGYRLGQYLNQKYGPTKTVMIGDYTALYLYYPGEVANYDINELSDYEIIVSTDRDAALIDRGYEKVDEYKRFDNVKFSIYAKDK